MPTVLVIDDEALVRDLLGRILMKAGLTVFTAEDGRRGVEIFDQKNPDVVITDIIMPEMGGVQAIRELRQRRPDVPIIAMSGGGRLGNMDVLTAASAFGANAALRKPFSRDELLRAVHSAIGECTGASA